MGRIMKWAGIVFVGLIVLGLLAGLALYPIGIQQLKRSDPGVPVEAIAVPSGTDAIARGKHVAIERACDECHGADLSGKLLADVPIVGTIPATNLTSGKGGAATSYSDADWVRAIRHGVKPDGRSEFFMYDYSRVSDQDLGALIAYLKQVPPVDSDYPAMHVGPLSAIVLGVWHPR